MESVELSFRRLRGNKILVGDEGVLTPVECQKLVVRSEALARKSRDADPQTPAELASLGKALGGGPEAPFSVDDCVQGPQSTVLYVRPQGDVRDWRLIEGIAWETAAGSHGGLIDMEHVLVRGYEGKAPSPLDLGDREPRVLFIGSSARSRVLSRLDVEKARSEVAAAWHDCIVTPEWRAIEGPDTMESLRDLLRSDNDWDIVHVVAHGFRDNETICLESADREEDYQKFSVLAEELLRLRNPRLFTLQVCGSSRLAIDIAFRHPGARVIGWLYEVSDELLSEFFALFYRRLFQPGPIREVHVEEVFRQTVRQLEQGGNPGWFLPVMYGPAQLAALMDRGAELSLQDIVRSVQAGDIEAARKTAVSCRRSPMPVVKVNAAHFVSNIDGLRAFDANFEEFEREIAQQASAEAPDWAGLHEKWSGRSFVAFRTHGPGVCSAPGDSTAIAVLPWFEGPYEDWKALKEAALVALQRLAGFQKGAPRDLLRGCRGLLSIGTARRPALESVAGRAFALGLRQLFAQARSPIPPRDVDLDRDEVGERVGRGLRLVSEAIKILDEGSQELLDEATAEDLRREAQDVQGEIEEGARRAGVPLQDAGGLEQKRALKRSRGSKRPTMLKVVISYRRADSGDVTGRIYDRLVAEFEPENIFRDIDAIPLGVDFRKHLHDEVSRCDVLLAVIGADWLEIRDEQGNRRIDDDADFVRIEIEAALQRDIPVVPLLVRGALIPRVAQLPSSLRALAFRNGIEIRSDPDFHNDMDRLIRALHRLEAQVPARRHSSASTAPPSAKPGVKRLECPACGNALRVAETHAGRQVRCPACKTPLQVSPNCDRVKVVEVPAQGLPREMEEQQVDGARRAAAGPKEELLDPSRRFELCRWVLRPGERSGGEARPPAAGDADELPEYGQEAGQTHQQREVAVDFGSLPAEYVPLVVNQTAPFLLVVELKEPLPPYLCLAPLGARPDSPARQIGEDVEYRAGAEGDAEFRGVLLQAVAELTDPRERLCLDAQLLPCGDVEECTRRFHRIADLVFHGHPVPEDVFVGVGVPDRAALLAVAGRTEEAANLGVEYAQQHLSDADALRAGCLLSVHHASVLPPDSGQLAPALRNAIALLGMLLGGPKLLREWIGRRFAVYQQVVPSDLQEHVEAVSNRLKADVTSRLYRLEEQGGELRDLARSLRQELQAELEGARLAATGARSLLGGQHGGYHAVRMTRGLEQLGQDLAGTFGRLASLDDTGYLTYVTATGMSVEVFHQLVFLFSDLRRAWIAPGDDVIPLIQDLLPAREDLEFAYDPPPGVGAALAAQDCRDRFPFHAALSPGAEATRALAAHAAIVAIESYHEQGKRLLAAEKLNRARLVIALDAMLALDNYVGRLDYPLADKCLDSLSRLEELCTNWLRSVEKHVVTTWEDPDEAESLRSLCEEILGLADHLSERYPFGRGDFRAAQGSLHRQCGVLGANKFRDGKGALRHLRKAYQCDPESAGIVINYLRACRMAHFQLPTGSQEAKQALEAGIRAAEEFLRAPTTGDRAQVEKDLNELREVRDRASSGPASPDFFPRLIEPEKMDD